MRNLGIDRTWQPARLTSGDMIFVVWALAMLPLMRAFDYSTGEDGSRSLGAVEAFAPLWVWAIPFYAGAIALFAGARTKRHLLVYVAHSILAVTYTALSAGIICSVVTHPWADGIRNGTGLLLPSMLHWLLWWRTGPSPVKLSEATPIETLEGPTP